MNVNGLGVLALSRLGVNIVIARGVGSSAVPRAMVANNYCQALEFFIDDKGHHRMQLMLLITVTPILLL